MNPTERELLDIQNLVNGAEGTVYLQKDNEMMPLLNVRSITATVTKEKETKKVIGSKVARNRLSGYTFAGTMNIYYCSSYFTKQLYEDIKNGTNTTFTLIVTNEDPASKIGRQSVALYNVDIDSHDILAIDIEASDMNSDIPFTFDDFELLEAFEEVNK